MFHVSSVAIVTCGLDVSSPFALVHQLLTPIKANGHLKDEPLPQAPAERRQFIQHLENHGCYIQRPIQINTTWTHEQVTSQIRGWFLQVFAYFDDWWELSTPLNNPQPDWQLLVPGGNGKLELSGAVHPNGIVLARFKGCQKSSIADSNLWFGTCLLVHYCIGDLYFQEQ